MFVHKNRIIHKNMQDWRWDQGRVLYFQYDVLKGISRVLCKYDGKNINDDAVAEEFRKSLIETVGLPFAPGNYKVNRNYSRVFQCSLLAATKGKNELAVSDLCKQLASRYSIFESADDYFMEVINRFRFPFPAFQEYNVNEERVYPFVAVIKYLVAKKVTGQEASASLQDIAGFIVGNNCTGLENLDFYKKLSRTGYQFNDTTLRQVREMILFISQISFLKVYNQKIYLDVLSEEDAMTIFAEMLKPFVHRPFPDKFDEFLSVTTIEKKMLLSSRTKTSGTTPHLVDPSSREFIEGKRMRTYHLKIERSPLLRKVYIQLHPEPICNACKIHIKDKYPWVDYMIDLHHLLPLSSVIRTGETGTLLEDLVGLCPSCHRAIHSYYGKWLKSNSREDFRNRKEAMTVYLDAVREIA